MNERIRELWYQAVQPHTGDSWAEQTAFMDKFAELIVDQMLAIADAHTEVFQTDRDKALIEHIKQSVKQHFGVEE